MSDIEGVSNWQPEETDEAARALPFVIQGIGVVTYPDGSVPSDEEPAE